MNRLILIALIPASLAGCASELQANYRPPRADELRPGDTAPSPGPFVDSIPRQPIQRQFAPMAAPHQVPIYQMPVQRQTYCNSQRIGNQIQTVCQ